MNKNQKEDVVQALRDTLLSASSVVVASHQGMPVNTVNALRSEFRKQGVEYTVVKNSLVRIAIEGTEFEALGSLLKGPSAIAFGYGDAPAPAKVVKKFAAENDKFVVKGGFLPGEGVLDAKGVNQLSEMLSKDELRSQLLGLFQAVPQKFVATLNEVPSGFARLLTAQKDSLAA